MDISIIIPCFNEVESIKKLDTELSPILLELSRSKKIEVIFVDDGSRDGTLQALKAAFTRDDNILYKYCQHETNRGLGAAIRTGFKTASGDRIVTTDSDGTYKFTHIPDLLDFLTDGTDIVTASPYHPDAGVDGVPAYRLVLSRGSSTIYRFLVDWKIHTYTCLFRAYRREVIDTISFTSDGFLAGTELMVKAMLDGFQVREFPAILYQRMYGVSKAKIMRTISAHLIFQWQVLLHRMHIKPIT